MSEKRVLIVDDSKDIGRMIAAALGTLDPGVQVKMMTSAEEAVLEITRQPFDLLVIDIRLPGISGLDLTRRIRSRNPNLKIIQISGLDDPQIGNEALQAGANAFFHKPISMSEFLRTTAVFLGLRPADSDVEISEEFQSDSQSSGIAEVLTATRKALNAISVVMTDGRGHVVVQAGKLPDPNLEYSLVPDLMEALQASTKVGNRMGQTQPGHVLGFRGPAFHVLAAPIYENYALIIFLKSERPALRMAIAFEEALEAQRELHRLIQAAHPLSAAEMSQNAAFPSTGASHSPGSTTYSPPPTPVAPVQAPAVSAPLQTARPGSKPLAHIPVPPPIDTHLAPPATVKPAEIVPPPTLTVAAAPEAVKPPVAPPPTRPQSPVPTPPPPAVVEKKPAPAEKPAKEEPPAGPVTQASLEESLDSLLRASADRRLEPKEIDAFWDDLTAQDNSAAGENPEMISYEQAIRMGLAPKDAGK
jgi:DNA-binding response OmpR family regulator